MSEWRLDRSSRELVVGDRRVRLSEKPFLVLEALLEARGGVVTREALRKRLWTDDTFVDFENNLNSAVATLRQALGDSARRPRFIETIPRVGYRLVLSPSPGAGRRVALAAGLAILALGAGWLLSRPDLESPARKAARAELERGLYLRGQFEARRDDGSLLEQALASFRRARRFDPSFGGAAAEEAETLLQAGFSGIVRFREALEQARGASVEALALTPADGTALRVSGMTALFLDWDVARARVFLERAKAADDRDARTALAEATLLAVERRHEEAIAAAERAVALDPEAFYVRADLALFYLAAGRDEEAAETTRRVLGVAPDFVPALSYCVLANERLGRFPEAAEAARTLMRLLGVSEDERARVERAVPRQAVALFRRWDLERIETLALDRVDDLALPLALRYATAGEPAAALECLERAYRNRDALLIFLPAFPELAPLHGEPGFEALSQRLRRG